MGAHRREPTQRGVLYARPDGEVEVQGQVQGHGEADGVEAAAARDEVQQAVEGLCPEAVRVPAGDV
jgi:hypothetical protein